MSATTEKPAIRFVWPKAGTELDLAPLQGLWTEAQYLKLTDQTNQLIEFTDGVIEVLPMPTRKHQRILAFLYDFCELICSPGMAKYSSRRCACRFSLADTASRICCSC
jgi:Uma2 family endonuclease